MALPRPEPGLVIRYNFLWRSEADAGREDASKVRPCAIITAVERLGDRTIVTVVPITHAAPREAADAIEMPQPLKQSLGLDNDRSWIVTTELNTFEWPGPDIEPIKPGSQKMAYGRLPKAMLAAVLRASLTYMRSGRARPVKRTE